MKKKTGCGCAMCVSTKLKNYDVASELAKALIRSQHMDKRMVEVKAN